MTLPRAALSKKSQQRTHTLKRHGLAKESCIHYLTENNHNIKTRVRCNRPHKKASCSSKGFPKLRLGSYLPHSMGISLTKL